MANFKRKRNKRRIPCMCKMHRTLGNGKGRFDTNTEKKLYFARREMKDAS